MNGKVLKVIQYNLEFGQKERYINLFGCFKYKPNGNLYVVYADVNRQYQVVTYGSSHINGNTILSMKCRDLKEAEIIKEYIFKVTNQESLEDFESISLENIEGIEIIGSDNLELKPDIISALKEITLPKQEPKEEEKIDKKSKKKSRKPLLILLLILLVGGIGYFVISSPNKNDVTKKIVCEKKYNHETLKATVDEVDTYNFNLQDTLESIDTIMTYQFDEEAYQDFILKGTYYKYLPDSNQDGGYKQDDEHYTFKIMSTKEIDTSYTKPTNYEEVFSYYKNEGFTCTEEIESE